MKKLLALFAFVSAHAFAGNLFCVTGIQSGTLECSYYVSVASGIQSVDVPYTSLVPSGETRPLRIYDGFMKVDNLYNAASHSLLVESPAGGNLWKYPVGWMFDSDGQHTNWVHLTQPVTLTSSDEACFDTWNATTYSAGTFALHYIIGP